MYVSSAYCNAHMPKCSTVYEQLYHLRDSSGKDVDHAAIVKHLLALPPEEAQAEVCLVCPSCIGMLACIQQLPCMHALQE